MDLKELEHHAKRHGAWTMQLTKRDVLECQHHQPENSEGRGWDDFSYYLNGVRVTKRHADDVIDGLFAQALGLHLVEKVA